MRNKYLLVLLVLCSAVAHAQVTGNFSKVEINSNVVIPVGTTGPHGNGAKVQFSDGTGTAGNVAVYDASGNVIDGGVTASITWSIADVHLSRAANTCNSSYQNTTANPMFVGGSLATTGSGTGNIQVVQGTSCGTLTFSPWDNAATATVAGGQAGFTAVIMPGYFYEVIPNSAVTTTVSNWTEMTGVGGGGGGGGSFVAGGDLSGTSSSQRVIGLNAVPFCTGFTPANGQFIEFTTGGSPNPCWAAATSSGSGITGVSVATANGFQGTSSGGSTPILTLNVDGTHYLPTTTDQTAWNAKQAAGSYITGLTGDGTATGPGSVAFTLTTVNSNVGSCGDATHVGVATYDAKGRATACSATSITFPAVPINTTSTASQFFTAYNSGTGAFTKAQPAFSDISGVAAPGQLPVATGSAFGAVKPDGTSCTVSSGVLTCPGSGGYTPPTGSGFPHITSGAQDPAARAVDLSSADATGTMASAREPAHTADVTNTAGSLAMKVVAINNTNMAALATGIVKNTTTTGVPSIAVAADFPTLNQNTTGSAAKLTTARTINGTSFDGTANITITAVPSGVCGGALSGSFPNCTIAGLGSTANVFTMTDGAGNLTVNPNFYIDSDGFGNFNVPGLNMISGSLGSGGQLPGLFIKNTACPGSPVEVSANAEFASFSSENALVVGHENGCQPSGLAPIADGSFITQTGYAHIVPGTSIYSVTNSQLTSNVVTLTASNALSAGQFVLVFNLTSATFLNNQVFTVLSASGTQFTFAFTHANVGSAAESGNAQQMVDNQLDITNQGGGIINFGFTSHTPLLSIRTGLAANGVFLPTLTSQPCLGTDATGLLGAGTCTGGTGISGATSGQALIAGSATTATSSKALAGAGAAIVTGPTTATATDIAIYTSTTGGLVDSGVAIANLPTLSGANNFTGASGFQGAANSGPLSVSNITAATSGANQSSPCFGFVAQYWTGSISAGDNWSICNVLGAGTNPTSTLTLGHIGSSGSATVALPALTLAAPLPAGSGGFGISTSALTGYPSDAAGTWSVATAAATFSTLYKTVATSLGDIVYGIATGTPTRLAGPTTNGLYALTENPTASVAVAPAFTVLAASATTDATNATNISTGTLGAARLPVALANSTSVNGTSIPASSTLALHIANGTSTLGTSPISSATCATVVTTTATGTATTDVVGWGFNGDPTAVTGYIPATTGMLTIIAYPSSGNVNFKVCNNTASSITPGSAITLNWTVIR